MHILNQKAMKPLKGCYLCALVVSAVITLLSNPSLTELGYLSIFSGFGFDQSVHLPALWMIIYNVIMLLEDFTKLRHRSLGK